MPRGPLRSEHRFDDIPADVTPTTLIARYGTYTRNNCKWMENMYQLVRHRQSAAKLPPNADAGKVFEQFGAGVGGLAGRCGRERLLRERAKATEKSHPRRSSLFEGWAPMADGACVGHGFADGERSSSMSIRTGEVGRDEQGR